jgi:hypothetical protein
MAHGLTSMLMGANFNKLQLYPNGSGVAQFSYTSIFMGNLGKALVAGAGPIGPTLAGAVFFYASTNSKATKITLWILAIVMIISLLLWVRPIYGIGALIILIFAVLIIIVLMRSNNQIREISLQFLGVQAFASVYMSVGYLFSSGGNIGESSFVSDTQVIANNLLLPHWFWAILLLVFSMYMLYVSLSHVIKKS